MGDGSLVYYLPDRIYFISYLKKQLALGNYICYTLFRGVKDGC